jgi:hypothetical protein
MMADNKQAYYETMARTQPIRFQPSGRGKPIGIVGPPIQLWAGPKGPTPVIGPPASTPYPGAVLENPAYRPHRQTFHQRYGQRARQRHAHGRHPQPMPAITHDKVVITGPPAVMPMPVTPKPMPPPESIPMPTGRTCPSWGWMVRTNADGSETVVPCAPGQMAPAGLHGLDFSQLQSSMGTVAGIPTFWLAAFAAAYFLFFRRR